MTTMKDVKDARVDVAMQVLLTDIRRICRMHDACKVCPLFNKHDLCDLIG